MSSSKPESCLADTRQEFLVSIRYFLQMCKESAAGGKRGGGRESKERRPAPWVGWEAREWGEGGVFVRKTSMRDDGVAQVRVRPGDPSEKMARIFVDVRRGSWETVGQHWAGRHRTRNDGWWGSGKFIWGTSSLTCR